MPHSFRYHCTTTQFLFLNNLIIQQLQLSRRARTITGAIKKKTSCMPKYPYSHSLKTPFFHFVCVDFCRQQRTSKINQLIIFSTISANLKDKINSNQYAFYQICNALKQDRIIATTRMRNFANQLITDVLCRLFISI